MRPISTPLDARLPVAQHNSATAKIPLSQIWIWPSVKAFTIG